MKDYKKMKKRTVIVANINNDREQRSLALKEIDDKCVGEIIWKI